MDLIRTARTYKTRANAEKALHTAVAKIRARLADAGDFPAEPRWLIASSADGRFAPVVIHDSRFIALMLLPEMGITIVS